MSPDELAAIVARAAESIVWAPGTLASDPAVSDKLWQASQDRRALLALLAEVRTEYQRFYDFVGESDPALVDAWHFTENARRLSPDRPTPP